MQIFFFKKNREYPLKKYKKKYGRNKKENLTVRLLVTGTGTGTSELLGFTTTGIGNEKSTIVLDESFLDLLLGSLVDKLLVESNDGLGKSLADSINLRSVTTTLDADSDINVGETFFTQKKDNFVDLELQDLGLEELDGGTVDTDETVTTLKLFNAFGVFFLKKKKKKKKGV
jgi:hypothetical protein